MLAKLLSLTADMMFLVLLVVVVPIILIACCIKWPKLLKHDNCRKCNAFNDDYTKGR